MANESCTRRQMLSECLAVVSCSLAARGGIVRSNLAGRSIFDSVGEEEELRFVEWIASDGKAWIDTGFVLVSGFTPFSINCVLGDRFVRSPYMGIGKFDQTKVLVYGFGCFHNDRRFYVKPRIGTDHLGWNKTSYEGNQYFDGEFHEVSVEENYGAGSLEGYALSVDGEILPLAVQYHGSPVSVTTESCALFATKENGEAVSFTNPTLGFKVQSFQIGDLDLRAAKIGGVGCMYDMNNETILLNSGDGSFIVGPDL